MNVFLRIAAVLATKAYRRCTTEEALILLHQETYMDNEDAFNMGRHLAFEEAHAQIEHMLFIAEKATLINPPED